jgi:hypothetical protein
MATYHVSPYGDDSNNGLGGDPTDATNRPWLTLTKALGAAGISSGDTLYIAPGVYREAVTVAMTSAVAETFIIGDVANTQGFCDSAGVRLPGGTVWISNSLGGDMVAPSGSAAIAATTAISSMKTSSTCSPR